jgi:hypothetical protein
MRKIAFVIMALFSSTALAVTGNGTGSSTQVTGNGTGSSVQVTGNGTGSSVQVTGGGTGSSVQVTGNGTGSPQVTGGGTGSSVAVTGNGTGSPQAVSIDACMSGSFYDPEAPGEGINVEVHDDFILVYFYDMSGEWMFLQGDDNGLDMYQPWADGVSKVGSGYFIPLDNDNVEFGFDQMLDLRNVTFERPIPWCLRSDCEFAKVLVRLTQPIPCADSETEVTGNGTGKPEVTGGGTGKPEVTGGGTGKPEVTGGGTGSHVQVTGGGTGRE